jgi:hypothetical protein
MNKLRTIFIIMLNLWCSNKLINYFNMIRQKGIENENVKVERL